MPTIKLFLVNYGVYSEGHVKMLIAYRTIGDLNKKPKSTWLYKNKNPIIPNIKKGTLVISKTFFYLKMKLKSKGPFYSTTIGFSCVADLFSGGIIETMLALLLYKIVHFG